MMLGKKWMSLFMVLIPVLFLAACGASTEEKVIGSWKAVADGETGQYIEIGEERLLNRSESVSAEYILTETQSDSFLIELINPEDGVPFPFFEGHFEGEDNIKLEKMMGEPIENAEFVRVDNMEEEQAKDEKAQEEAEEEKRAAEDAEKQEEVAQAEAETVEDDELKDFTAASEYIIELIDNGRLGEAEERLKLLGESFTSEEYISSLRAMDDMIESAKYEREQEKNSRDDNSLKEEYVQKAKMLDEEIEQIHNGPAPVGVYGDYLEDWDGLLNEVWGVLADTMPEEQFEQLKQDQIKWVQEKNADFEKARGEIDAKDRLTNTTRERTYYLIENYLDV
ncbi:lysozyme inhibitor LprI family protein [Oceanobacillus kapialis]|uniref:lysozyme inhibitor LprI family protein n=1 Tax=Oceanobacillus kapialis TaxID=481353 RepID=UPI0038516391